MLMEASLNAVKASMSTVFYCTISGFTVIPTSLLRGKDSNGLVLKFKGFILTSSHLDFEMEIK